MKKSYRKNFLAFVLSAIMAMLALSAAGCGSSVTASDTAAVEMASGARSEAAAMDGGIYDSVAQVAVEEEAKEEGTAEKVNENAAATQQRKLIKNVDMSVETEEFDKLISNVEAKVEMLSGYIESSNIYNGSYTSNYRSRSASITARIPSEMLDQFITDVAEWSNVTRKNEYVEDVTLTYVDLETHKKALQAEQESLLAMLEKAESIEDIITINAQLTDVRYQIESMESQLRTYDNKINYSTVYLDVQEIEQYEPYVAKSTGERIREGFMRNVHKVTDGMKEFFIELVIALPIILVACVIIGIGIAILVFLVKRSEKHAAKRRQIRAQQYDAQKAGRQQSPALRYRTPENTAYSETSDASENGAEKEKGSENS
ncbi:MAG: DUF4349 domain-containing protein [Lachnospiraceae bacterium]|nr:DUF4349 domain-containing protein [Lachnospiraceae bacterium]